MVQRPSCAPWGRRQINCSAARRAENDVAERVREARASLEEERSRLAALMADLSQSVVVCNLDGRVLLYNQRAKQELSAGPTAAMPNCLASGVRFTRCLIGR
jgi:DNA polymerase-3 subunit epsilon